MGKRLTRENFIKQANKIHNNKYDYSLVDYKNNHTKVKIICMKHVVFEQRPSDHLRGFKCSQCRKVDFNEFIEKCKIKHKNKYDYSLVKFNCITDEIKIICPKHGLFTIRANSHLNHGCRKCGDEYRSKEFLMKTEDVIKQFKNTHGDKYDYSLMKYLGNKRKIKIICKKHGIFEQKPREHKNGAECPKCRESKGESKISQILEKNNIKYLREKKFKNCKDKQQLPFDFYLPNYNFCIEFDGKQHFESVKYWGGEEGLKYTQSHDKIKNQYCHDNNINLLRIKYDENIEEKLNLQLFYCI